MFPIKNYRYKFPKKDEPSSFGYVRKFDIHTGVDLYCENGTPVYSMCDGVVVNIEDFTGEFSNPPTPWWLNTKSVLVETETNVICYGEITTTLSIGDKIKEGDIIGNVSQVLKNDKGLPMSMLHIELYDKGVIETVIWNIGEEKPKNLQDITTFLFSKYLINKVI